MAQWIRRWSTEPEILGSIPSEVVFLYILFSSIVDISMIFLNCSYEEEDNEKQLF